MTEQVDLGNSRNHKITRTDNTEPLELLRQATKKRRNYTELNSRANSIEDEGTGITQMNTAKNSNPEQTSRQGMQTSRQGIKSSLRHPKTAGNSRETSLSSMGRGSVKTHHSFKVVSGVNFGRKNLQKNKFGTNHDVEKNTRAR